MNIHASNNQPYRADIVDQKARPFTLAETIMDAVPRRVHEAEVKRLRQRHYESSAKHRKAADALSEAEITIGNLELRLADMQATLLRQADTICGYQSRDELAALASVDGNGKSAQEIASQPIRRSVKEIVDEVLLEYPDVSWEDIKGVRRTRILIQPRHACVYAVYSQRPDLSYPTLGRIFKRDHTSLIFAVRKMEKQHNNQNDRV